MSKILVVEDEKDVKDLMTLHLKREGHETTAVENGEEALKLLEAGTYDLAVLDWMLPGVSGLDICQKAHDKVTVLMVTARADSTDIVRGLEAGADDYVTKPFEISVFLARVRALLRRSSLPSLPSAERYTVEGLKVNPEQHRVWCDGTEIKLTVSEFKLIVALLENRGRVLSRDKLIDCVQGEGIVVSDRTIDTHVFGLRKKLGNCAEVVETIRGVGYRIKS